MGLVDKKNSRVKRKTAEAPMTIKKFAASYKRAASTGTLVALATLGDSFLYAALPVHYREVVISSSSMALQKICIGKMMLRHLPLEIFHTI